jgi:hypothetical protein
LDDRGIRDAAPPPSAPEFHAQKQQQLVRDAKRRGRPQAYRWCGAHHTTPQKPQRLPARPKMSAAASLSHQQWEQQLSGIIERTNANLNALSTRYSPARPAESVRRSAERQSWDAFEERDRRPVPSESVETFIDDDAIERSVARALARWNVGNVQGGDNALQRLEDEVATLRASETAAATARRSREATVDALAREVHARRGHASKMLAWQADAEQWRSRVDAALEKAAATQAGLEASQRRITESNKRSATQAEVKGVLDAARRQAQAAAQGAVAAGQSAMEHELEDLRRQVAALRLRSGESLGGDDMAAARAAPAAVESAVQAAVSQAFAAAEAKLEDKLASSLGSALRAEASEALMDARRQLENTLDSRAAALGGGSSGSYGDDDRAAKAVDKAVAKLVGDVDSARNEVDELKRAREADLRDARLAQKKLEQQLETVRAECADKIGQVVEATRTARAALDDARAATHKSLDSLRTELYGALDQRSDDWRDDRADLVRGLARCDRAIGAIEGKLDVAKTTARAFAEEAPAVKRAGELAGKVESVDARVDALDAKVGRFRDAERRSATDRARLDALETWQRGARRGRGITKRCGPARRAPRGGLDVLPGGPRRAGPAAPGDVRGEAPIPQAGPGRQRARRARPRPRARVGAGRRARRAGDEPGVLRPARRRGRRARVPGRGRRRGRARDRRRHPEARRRRARPRGGPRGVGDGAALDAGPRVPPALRRVADAGHECG